MHSTHRSVAPQGVEWTATWIFRYCFDAYIVRAMGDVAHNVLCEYSYYGHLPGKPESCTFYGPKRTSLKPNQQVSNVAMPVAYLRFNFIVAIRCVRTMLVKMALSARVRYIFLFSFYRSLFHVHDSIHLQICRISHADVYTLHVFTMLAHGGQAAYEFPSHQ